MSRFLCEYVSYFNSQYSIGSVYLLHLFKKYLSYKPICKYHNSFTDNLLKGSFQHIHQILSDIISQVQVLCWGCFQIIVVFLQKKKFFQFSYYIEVTRILFILKAYPLNTVVAHPHLLLNIMLHQWLFYFDTRNTNWKSNFFEVSAILLFQQ